MGLQVGLHPGGQSPDLAAGRLSLVAFRIPLQNSHLNPEDACRGGSGSALEPTALSLSLPPARAAQYACSLLGHALQKHGASLEMQKQVRQLEGHLSLGRKRK